MLQDKPSRSSYAKDKRYKTRDKIHSPNLAYYHKRLEEDNKLIKSIAACCGVSSEGIYISSRIPPTLIIQTNNSVLATQLRLQHQSILELVNLGQAFYRQIKIEVRPIYQKQHSKQKKMRAISATNAQLLEDMAHYSNNEKLSKVLLRLARHTK